ncbi:MAG: hypothetical protein OEU93_01575 [Rubrivivax sp.]|nr:hypothetical protein [Rubrivivax sp.]
MQGSNRLDELGADVHAAARRRKDRLPVGRFLLLFAGLLAAALNWSALTPDVQGDKRAAVATSPAPSQVTRVA